MPTHCHGSGSSSKCKKMIYTGNGVAITGVVSLINQVYVVVAAVLFLFLHLVVIIMFMIKLIPKSRMKNKTVIRLSNSTLHSSTLSSIGVLLVFSTTNWITGKISIHLSSDIKCSV